MFVGRQLGREVGELGGDAVERRWGERGVGLEVTIVELFGLVK